MQSSLAYISKLASGIEKDTQPDLLFQSWRDSGSTHKVHFIKSVANIDIRTNIIK